jgi:hypothetical protein
MRFYGLGDLERHLQELSDAFSGMDDVIGKISLAPEDPGSLNKAIAQMEAALDAHVAAYGTNQTVREIIVAMKEEYAAGIRQNAMQLSRNGFTQSLDKEQPLSTEGTTTVEGLTVPKAFMSHSHADKKSIVRPLDRLLREVEGIQVWLDERDMPAGADIVDAIFSKGIGEADAVIVVLTPNSINSRWVYEELNVSVVRKIKQLVKAIIPVLYGISDEDVPDALVATNWIRLQELSEKELADCARRIGAALHGIAPAPVAPAPLYAGIPIHRLPSLTANDERLFAEACRQYMERNYWHPAVDSQDIVAYAESIGIPKESVIESLHALEQHYYVKLQFYMGSGNMPAHFEITDYGFEEFLTAYKADDYGRAKKAVISEIVNRNAHNVSMISASTGVGETLLRHILKQIESRGQAKVLWHSGGGSIMPEPTLKRLLDE